jgi:hypothetical protein
MRKIILAAALLCAAPLAAMACPVVTPGVQQVSISSADLQNPYRLPVVAGGDINLGACGYPGGYVIANPDFSFYVTGVNGPMQFSVDSPGCDTVLLVHTADAGFYYDDDSSGDLMPYLEAVVYDGRVDVWVGTYGGNYCDAQIVLY